MPTSLKGPSEVSTPQRFQEVTHSFAMKCRNKQASNSTPQKNGFAWHTHPPLHLRRGIVPLNLAEEKENFLKFGRTPQFKINDTAFEVQQLMQARMAQINFSLFHDAKRILDTVVERFGSLDQYVASTYGERISTDEATVTLRNYLNNHKLEKNINVIWCDQLAASAQMTWIGPDARFNRPDARKYTLLIKSSSENNFVRERGITCLADHEIGTHYIRSSNDGLQPWFADRTKYDLKPSKSYETIKSEEGLAALHTVLNARFKYLCMPAMLYYNACMAEYLSFRQLFHHIEKFMKDPEQRWKHCMRVKRGLQSTDDKGGYGKDQRYFEGAVEIMRHLDVIDFNVFISGRICWDEVPRVRRVCRLGSIKLPHFMLNMSEYLQRLQMIADINGIRLASEKDDGPSIAEELQRTREHIIDALFSYDSKVLHHYNSWRSTESGDRQRSHHSRSKYHSRKARSLKKGEQKRDVQRQSTRESLIEAITTTPSLERVSLECEDTPCFIEFDARHPIANTKDYDDVMRDD